MFDFNSLPLYLYLSIYVSIYLTIFFSLTVPLPLSSDIFIYLHYKLSLFRYSFTSLASFISACIALAICISLPLENSQPSLLFYLSCLLQLSLSLFTYFYIFLSTLYFLCVLKILLSVSSSTWLIHALFFAFDLRLICANSSRNSSFNFNGLAIALKCFVNWFISMKKEKEELEHTVDFVGLHASSDYCVQLVGHL